MTGPAPPKPPADSHHHSPSAFCGERMGTWVGTVVTVSTLCHLLQADRAFSWDWGGGGAWSRAALRTLLSCDTGRWPLPYLKTSQKCLFAPLYFLAFIFVVVYLFTFSTIYSLFLKFQSLFGSPETEEGMAGKTRAQLCGYRESRGVEGGRAVGAAPPPAGPGRNRLLDRSLQAPRPPHHVALRAHGGPLGAPWWQSPGQRLRSGRGPRDGGEESQGPVTSAGDARMGGSWGAWTPVGAPRPGRTV